MPSYNLVEEPWIPCVLPNGSTAPRSLRDVLLDAHNIAEVRDDSPLVTVALLRLLLAVLYSAYGFRKEEDWEDWWQETWPLGRFPTEPLCAYLDQWHDRFDLFSDAHPFFQTGGLETTSQSTPERLVLESQNAHFHHVSPDGTLLTAAQAARLLAALHSYAIGFGKASDAKLPDGVEQRPYSKDGPLLRGVTVWVSGPDLFQTLMLNLAPTDLPEADRPSWEHAQGSYLYDKIVNGARRTYGARGPADRFTWLSRMIRLLPEPTPDGVAIRNLYFTQGRGEDDSTWTPDPMKCYRRSEDAGETPVSLSEDRSTWRDYHALLAEGRSGFRQPAAIRWLSHVRYGGFALGAGTTVHVVGMASAPKKAAKLELWRHDRMPLPVALLNDDDAELVRLLLQDAEDVEWGDAKHPSRGVARQIRHRFRAVLAQFLVPDGGKDGKTAAGKDDVSQLFEAINPLRTYWSRLEGHFHHLLLRLPEDRETAKAEWWTAVEKEAESAYREACQRLGGSALAIQAVARYPDRFYAPGRPQPATSQEANP